MADNKNTNAKSGAKKRPVKGGAQAKKSNAGLATVVERREFYKDMYSKMWKIAAVGVTSLAMSIGMGVYVLNHQTDNVYFATDENGSLIKLIELSQPNQKDATVANWLTRALVDTFDFNYHNIKYRLNDSAMRWFTEEGSKELITAINDSGNFDVVVDRKIIVSLETEHTPLVIKKGRPSWSPYYLWKLQVPAKITYRTESNVYSNKVVFTVVVSRRSLLEDPSGLGISNIIMTVRDK